MSDQRFSLPWQTTDDGGWVAFDYTISQAANCWILKYRDTQLHVGFTDVECKIEADRHRQAGSMRPDLAAALVMLESSVDISTEDWHGWLKAVTGGELPTRGAIFALSITDPPVAVELYNLAPWNAGAVFTITSARKETAHRILSVFGCEDLESALARINSEITGLIDERFKRDQA